jgi:UDP-2,3-diacylglucosamine hydrolase
LTGKKTYFISDIHLGSPALANNKERELLFVKWLEMASNDASDIYLLGDIFDFWFEYRKVVPRGFVRTLGKIATLTDAGIKIHFFPGNHDGWVSDYFSKETGMIIHPNPEIITLNGKVFYLGHGDGLDPSDKGYLILKRLFKSPTARFFFSNLHPNVAIWFGHLWAKRSRISKGIEAEYTENPDLEPNILYAKKMLKNQVVNYFLFGHRHIFLKKEIQPNSFVLFLGEWINFFSYAVFDGNTTELKKFTYNIK